MSMRTLILMLALASGLAWAEVTPVAHYSLKGAGGIRDTACPEVLKDLAGQSPELKRLGSPRVMSNGPECRRQEYDSSIKFEQPDQGYAVAKNLVGGDNLVLEAWAYALKGNDGGWHTVVANGNGGTGFLLAQNGDQWAVLVGGVGGTNLGQVVPETWVHLAVVDEGGQASGWLNGKKVCRLPGIGGGAPNFSVGSTAPGKEPFSGWVAEVRYSIFKPGKFDPAGDFLMDTGKLREIQAAEQAVRAREVEALLKSPGIQVVEALDERPYAQDWLVTPCATASTVQVRPDAKKQSARIMLSNGLVSRTFLMQDGSLGCIGFRRSDQDLEFLRTIKPEVRFRINGGGWLEVGGLSGMPDHGFLTPEWYGILESRRGAAFRFAGMEVGPCVKPYEWRPKCNAPADIAWPAKGCRATFHYVPAAGAAPPARDLAVDIVYEIYDGLPVVMKTFSVKNNSAQEMVVTQFEGEHLAVTPSLSRMMHVESDYSCGAINFTEQCSGLGIHASGGRAAFKDYYLGGGTTRFVRDPDWGSMATLNPAEDIFLKDPENALLLSRPTVGPNWTVKAGERFDAFRTFEILNDVATGTERAYLAQRRFYSKLAPQSNEKLFEVHAPYSRDLATLGPLMDQMAELGFGQLQAPEHPGGFNYADLSEGNVKSMKAVCDYAKGKGIRVGAYQLVIASVGRGADVDCIDPVSHRPGSMFGQSVCAASKWGDMYYENLWKMFDLTGMGAFKPDGPYHGDPCASTEHAHHKGLEDSQWAQWKWMCSVLAEGQRRDLYLTIPDWYVLNGQTCTGMGYREATDNIDIVLQTVLYRQYIFDGTFHKKAQMGWVNLNTETLRGGMEKNLDKYERMFFTQLSSGAQVWVRGHRLYDGPQSKAMLQKWMAWYQKYHEVILGDIIHLKRPDGRGLDYTLHVNPQGREKGMLLVFNPTPEEIRQTLELPLYYTGLTETAKIREQEGPAKAYALDRDSKVKLPVAIPANGYSWFIVE